MKHVICLLLISCQLVLAAQEKTLDFYDNLKTYNLSAVINPDSITDGYDTYAYTEPLGFTGLNYHRFRIHFSSIIKEKDNQNKYRIKGMTMRNDTVRPFVGSIKVINAELILDNARMADIDSSSYKEGYFIAEVDIKEDFVFPNSGVIKGKLATSFVLDTTGKLLYNALQRYSDSFTNNQFEGLWTSYKGNITEKCNWGDGDVPDSGDLNYGAGEFVPNEKYQNNGWMGYLYVYQSENEEEYDSRLEKEMQWWRKTSIHK